MDGIKVIGPGLVTDQNWMIMRYFPDPKFYKFGEVKKLTTDDTLMEIRCLCHFYDTFVCVVLFYCLNRFYDYH